MRFATEKRIMKKILSLQSKTGYESSIFDFTLASTLHHLMTVCVMCAALWGIIVLALGI